jgi:MoaA/NifB/PqqE/SkfB family radical SAM enzyme
MNVASPLGLLWRGPLDSCNYGCAYCPFAKRAPQRRVLDADGAALARFVAWVERSPSRPLQILFTPYGEALIWPWYRDALIALARLPHVQSVAIQTNGSAPMDFVANAAADKLAFWISYHPTEIARAPFIAKVRALHGHGLRLSVGMVAMVDNLAEIEALRAELPPTVPLWLNAQKPGPRIPRTVAARLLAIDPEFGHELRRHASLGRACHTGEDVISVDGRGDIRRCHFVADVLGNLYRDDLAELLRPRPCPRATCSCWLGYSHLTDLEVGAAYLPDFRLARIRAEGAPAGLS